MLCREFCFSCVIIAWVIEGMSPGLEESGSALGETTPSPGRDIYNATSGCQVFLRFHISALISFITGILYRKCQVFMDSSLVLAPFY